MERIRKRIEKRIVKKKKMQIQGLERNLDQLCTWLVRFSLVSGAAGTRLNKIWFCCGRGEPSSERYFMDESFVVTEACGVASIKC